MPASRIACLLPPAPDAATLALLTDVAAGFSPDIEVAAEAVYLEVGDLGRLYPTEDALLDALLDAASELAVEVCIAIACDKGVARVRARGLKISGGARGAVVRRGAEKAALGPLPIAALITAPEILARLLAFGIRTVSDFAALPRPAVATRLPKNGAELHRLACGESKELLQKTPPPVELCEEQELLDPVDNLEPLLFVLRGLLERLLVRLKLRSQACGDLTLHLDLIPRGTDSRQIAVAAPTQKVALLLELVRVALETKPPQNTVQKLRLCTSPARPRATQLDLFTPAGPAPEKLAATLARLEQLCGSGRVGRPVVPDSFGPSAAALAAFTPKTTPAEPTKKSSPLCLLAAKVLRPPQPLTVSTDGAALKEVAPPAAPASSVRRFGGPYRLRDVRGTRDYYDVELTDGGLLRLFYDLALARWFLDAVYD